MAEERVLLGFDVGGTKIGIGLGTESGKILGSARIPNVDTYPEEILPKMVSESKRLVAEAGLDITQVSAFGISVPFPADAVNGIMTAVRAVLSDSVQALSGNRSRTRILACSHSRNVCICSHIFRICCIDTYRIRCPTRGSFR